MGKFFELFAKNVRSIIAISVIYLSFGFLFALLFISVPEKNQTIINVATGAVIVAGVAAVVGYYFGSSKDKSDVDKADSDIEKKAAGITVTPP